MTPGERLVVEPEVVQRAFRWYIDYNGRKREGTTYLWAHVISAHYESGNHWVLLRTQQGTKVLVRPKLLIDASVEGDLARMLGAHYRFGMSEQIYGPETGPPPVPASDAPDTWIQRVSVLLTLKVYPALAPIIASGNYYGYSPSLYANYIPWTSQDNLRKFATSWSMTHVLPNGKRELNEAWSDYPLDIKLPHSYIFGYDSDPLIRQDLRNRIIQYVVDKVRYLQEHGYSHVGIATVPNRIYLREGIRVIGRDTYTALDIEEERARQTIAFGFYALYDVHLPIIQNHNGAFVHVPMGSLISAEMPDLLIPGPISTDHRAYNSAVRMEPLRANYGGAAGVIAAIALGRGVSPGEVAYPTVKNELLRQGYRLAFESPLRPMPAVRATGPSGLPSAVLTRTSAGSALRSVPPPRSPLSLPAGARG
ncbi:MAG: FAD-dependent oxidoreductase [Thermoleophilia bacterium]